MLVMIERTRIYAVSGKNRIIAVCFGVITASQLGLGIYMSIHTAGEGGEPRIEWCS